MRYMITAPLKIEYFFPLGFIYLKNCCYPQIFTVYSQTCAGGSGAKKGENMSAQAANAILILVPFVIFGIFTAVHVVNTIRNK